MKKIIRTLGLSLVLALAVTSCTKDDNETNNQDTTLNMSTLSNIYIYEVALVPVAVDLDKDGIKNQNLMVEKINQCTWDNVLEFKGDRFTITDIGILCDTNNTGTIILDAKYVLDINSGTIKLYDNNSILIETLTNVKFYYNDDVKVFKFDLYDSNLKQTVSYSLKIK